MKAFKAIRKLPSTGKYSTTSNRLYTQIRAHVIIGCRAIMLTIFHYLLCKVFVGDEKTQCEMETQQNMISRSLCLS